MIFVGMLEGKLAPGIIFYIQTGFILLFTTILGAVGFIGENATDEKIIGVWKEIESFPGLIFWPMD
jgi:hypothetical protein